MIARVSPSDIWKIPSTNALVEGIFQISDGETLAIMQEIGVESEEGEIHIKRQISNSGKNRGFSPNWKSVFLYEFLLLPTRPQSLA